jgi:hypothetical protein
VSGGLGFVVAYDVLHLGLIPSLFVALTTTNISVVLLALLTALFPYLQQGVGPGLVRPMLWTFAIVLLKMTGLMLMDLMFARYSTP